MRLIFRSFWWLQIHKWWNSPEHRELHFHCTISPARRSWVDWHISIGLWWGYVSAGNHYDICSWSVREPVYHFWKNPKRKDQEDREKMHA